MLRVYVKKNNIERALKELKSKFIKTKTTKLCRENKEFIKPSDKKRAIKSKAIYNENKKRDEEI